MKKRKFLGEDITKTILVDGKNALKVEEFRSFGYDEEFLAVSGGNIYYRHSENIYKFLCAADPPEAKDGKNSGKKLPD